MQTISVSPQAGGGMFHRIQDAIDSIPDTNHTPVRIALAPGVYHEKLILEKPFVTLCGTGKTPADTIITYSDFGNDTMPDGSRRGTFRSYTLFVHAPDVTLRNLTVENASGDSASHGQAIALYVECDRFFADSCRLLGHQDTLFTGPLPPRELQPNGFLGPTQHAPRVNGRQYYQNCYICGDVDFIFGSATAYFQSCTLESLRRSKPAGGASSDPAAAHAASKASSAALNNTAPEGYVTAASTPEGQEYGYVFADCHFLSHDCPAASVYLGRPWRDYARTVLLNCVLDAHIHPAGFHDWNKPQARVHCFYAEYNSCCTYTDGAYTCTDNPDIAASDAAACDTSARADFVHMLDAAAAAHFSREQVLLGTDGFAPWRTYCGEH